MASEDDRPIAGRIAVVSGATGAIGRHVVSALADAGAIVAVHYRHNREAAEALVRSGCGGAAVSADLQEPAGVDRLFDVVEAELGPPTILVNSAHPVPNEPARVADMPVDALDRHLDGVRTHHALCRRAVPAMRQARFGRIVFVSGALMTRPAEGFSAFGAAKAAASVLTRYLALEEGRYGITANVVAPGRVADLDEPEPDDVALRELSDRLLQRMALPRFPTPREVAQTITALTLPALSQVTGQTVWVTGGEPIA